MSRAEVRLRMLGFLSKCKVAALVVVFLLIGLTALYELLKPVSNGCIMTYMYPTYIPISTPANVSSDKYGLFLYHEGWKKIDFDEHIKKLDGVPVLFIPGNGGSYKQVRSLAAESSRAYQGGPLEAAFYREASFLNVDISDAFKYPTKYKRMLDWFAVDLEGEHSAMDGRILKEHTEYVVYSIHRILDLYKYSREARLKEGADASGSLHNSVILVGHSMGGFVARAAVIHPHLRKSAVETILTLSSPHQAPPVALQPSLGHYFSQVNREWKKGFMTHATHAGHTLYSSKLSHVVVVSVSGGFNDYQVRSNLASLDGIVPSTNGFMISSSSMKNVWRSMEHQTILWCNQLVIQLSHTLLTLINHENGLPFKRLEKRLLVFSRMLQSGLPQSLGLIKLGESSSTSRNLPVVDVKDTTGLQNDGFSFCPPSLYWRSDVLEKDLSIHSTSVTVLAMDGRRRWLDIRNQSSNGKEYFIFVTNLAPCSGVRLHLWPEKHESSTGAKLLLEKGIQEVTSKMAYIPTGPVPRQIEPGSQTEQAPPSSVLILTPEEMQGYRFLTISVAPRPTVSGRPPPAVSMAVGQFFNPKDGERKFSPSLLLRTTYSKEEMLLKEDHTLALNLSFSISLGVLPVTISLQTEGCGLKDSADHVDQNSLCRLRCFPSVGLAWDSVSGLHVIPNLNSETVIVDSSPAMWDSGQGSDKTILFLLVDPHCSYKISVGVSLAAASSRFWLLYSSQIIGFMVTGVLFGLMRQAHAWELDLSFPSILTAVELNLRMPRPFLLLAVLPTFASLALSSYTGHELPVVSYVIISIVCYLIANGSLFILIFSSQLIFYMVAVLHVFMKRRWLALHENFCAAFLHQIIDFLSILWSLKVVQILRSNPSLVVGFFSISVVCLVHPALGLFVLLFYHAIHCHAALCWIGFVTQDDVLFPQLTVEETLVFAAFLRLPKNMTMPHKYSKADAIIKQLSLERCRHTKVGGTFVRGISGGERKRTSIGYEILVNPPLLFLDEPTSGLDSTSANKLFLVLQSLAKTGRTIITTIHQPSSRIFYMFDKLLLISDGYPIYSGKACDSVGYFSSLGFAPEIAMNPAEFVLDLATGEVNDISIPSDLQGSPNPEDFHLEVIKFLQLKYKSEVEAREKYQKTTIPKQLNLAIQVKKEWTIGWIEQFLIISRRTFKERSMDYLDKLRLLQTVGVAVLLGLLWWKSKIGTEAQLRDQVGLMFYLCIFWTSSALFGAVYVFPFEKAYLVKENKADMYKLSVYYVSSTLCDMIAHIFYPTIFLLILYFMVDLRRTAAHFFLTLFALSLIVVTSQGIGELFGAACLNIKRAGFMASLVLMLFLLTGGYYVQHLPKFMRWMKHISFMHYGFRLLLKVQYSGDLIYDCQSKGGCRSLQSSPSFDTINLHSQWNEIWILAAMALIYRLLAYCCLRKRIGVYSI